MSAADVITALFFGTPLGLRYDFNQPKRLDNDRFVLSKGHAAPLLYSAWATAGLISESDLLSLRRLDSIYEGHPTPRIPWIDVATGSLGQGLPNAVGMAVFLKQVVHSPARVFVLCGDGELAEGAKVGEKEDTDTVEVAEEDDGVVLGAGSGPGGIGMQDSPWAEVVAGFEGGMWRKIGLEARFDEAIFR